MRVVARGGQMNNTPKRASFRKEVRSDASELTPLLQIAVLRVIVAALGERVTPPWWRTQFLTDFGFRTVARAFPRTSVGAVLSSAFAAARMEHDRRVGLGKRYHLFRLFGDVERGVSSSTSDPTLLAKVTGLVASSQHDLMQQLTSLMPDQQETFLEGPITLGPVARVIQPDILSSLAFHYWSGFSSGRRVFPYFTEPLERPDPCHVGHGSIHQRDL
jgi:hypothetical protein